MSVLTCKSFLIAESETEQREKFLGKFICISEAIERLLDPYASPRRTLHVRVTKAVATNEIIGKFAGDLSAFVKTRNRIVHTPSSLRLADLRRECTNARVLFQLLEARVTGGIAHNPQHEHTVHLASQEHAALSSAVMLQRAAFGVIQQPSAPKKAACNYHWY
jgi:hypothetical protein